jgi:hypothetical protein
MDTHMRGVCWKRRGSTLQVEALQANGALAAESRKRSCFHHDVLSGEAPTDCRPRSNLVCVASPKRLCIFCALSCLSRPGVQQQGRVIA